MCASHLSGDEMFCAHTHTHTHTDLIACHQYDRRETSHSVENQRCVVCHSSCHMYQLHTCHNYQQRVFTPTIPPRRVKKADQPQAAPTPPPPSPNKDKKQGKGLSQKEKQERKRRDRKREVVTSASVFSMGPAELLQDSRGL